MAAVLVQSKAGVNTGNGSATSTVTFDSTATSGNILIMIISTGGSGVLTSTPVGWTVLEQDGVAAPSFFSCYKVSDGTETDAVGVFVNYRDTHYWFGEYSGLSGTTPVEYIGTRFTSNSLETETTSTIAAESLILTFINQTVADLPDTTSGFTQISLENSNGTAGLLMIGEDTQSSGTLVAGFDANFNRTYNIGLTVWAVAAGASAAVTDGTGVTSSSGAGTADLPDVSGYTVSTLGSPFTSASHTIEYVLSDGTDTEVLAGTYNPKTGYAVQEITSAVKTEGSIFENYVGTITDTSQIYYPTADTTSVSATGIVTTDATADIDMQFWDASDDTWKQQTLLISSTDGNNRAMLRPMISTMVRGMIK